MALFTDKADVSVRPAVKGDHTAIARVQLASWIATHGEDVAEDVWGQLDTDAMAEQWRVSIEEPPSRKHRVLVACEGADVIGFAAVAPPGDLIALEVQPDRQRLGHGARLLAASVDTLKNAQQTQVRAWALASDTARQDFLRSTGLEPDGAARQLDLPGGGVREERWAATL